MDCQKQISLTCKSAWYQLKHIGKLWQYLDKTSTEQLVHSIVSSKFDINNALLHGPPDTLLHTLQVIPNHETAQAQPHNIHIIWSSLATSEEKNHIQDSTHYKYTKLWKITDTHAFTTLTVLWQLKIYICMQLL